MATSAYGTLGRISWKLDVKHPIALLSVSTPKREVNALLEKKEGERGRKGENKVGKKERQTKNVKKKKRGKDEDGEQEEEYEEAAVLFIFRSST